MSKYAQKEYRVGDYWLSQRSGSPAFYHTFYDEKTRTTKRASLGTHDRETAKRLLDEWYMAQRMQTAQDLSAADVTLAEVFKEYLDNHAVNLRSYKSSIILLRYWEEFWGEGATVADVRNIIKQEAFRATLLKKGLAINSMNRCLEAGRAAITVARWLRREGVSPWEVGAQLGHKMPGYNITEMYASASPDYLEKSAEAIEKLLRAVIPLDAPPIPQGR